ncbi:MAG: prephenate dehydratase domain-containing protein [Bacteroidota bacterium]
MKKVKVAIQGSAGSFHDQAAGLLLGDNIELIECATFSETFDAFDTREADYVVVAVENTIYGQISSNFKLIDEYFCKVISEVSIRIELHLLALPGVRIEDITEIHSHPIALAQCGNFLDNYRHLEISNSQNTAYASKEIAEHQLATRAAIANETCAALYGLNVLAGPIQNQKEDYTRFLLVQSATAMKRSLNATIPTILQINQLKAN